MSARRGFVRVAWSQTVKPYDAETFDLALNGATAYNRMRGRWLARPLPAYADLVRVASLTEHPDGSATIVWEAI